MAPPAAPGKHEAGVPTVTTSSSRWHSMSKKERDNGWTKFHQNAIRRFFEQTDFMKSYTVPSSMDLGDLDVEVDPIFHKSNFPDADYNIIKPSAQLATLLLYHSQAMLSTIVNHGKFEKLPGVGQRGENQYAYAPQDSLPSRSITRDQNQALSSAMHRLADIIVLNRDRKLTSGGMTHPVEGVTDIDRVYPNEMASIVSYSGRAYSKLRDATKAVDVVAVLVYCADFAIMLAHECVMRSSTLGTAYLSSKPFFGNNGSDAPISEVGYEFETRLFGGHVTMLFDQSKQKEHREHLFRNPDGSISNLEGVAVLWEWPYNGIVNEYLRNHFFMGVRPGVLSMLRPQDVAWRIPLDYFRKLFTKAFWERNLKERGTAVLNPPKTVGHVFSSDDRGNKWPQTVYESNRAQYVPEGYRLQPAGDFVWP